MTHRNIYIRSLEIGFKAENDGISYSELRNILETEKYSFNDKILKEWYFSNFEHPNRRRFVADPMEQYIRDESDTEKRVLCSDSFMQYVEYLELKEARESTQKAFRQSRVAIYIAALSIFLNVIFSEPVIERFYNHQKSTKTVPEMGSSIKEESVSQNDLPAKTSDLQKTKALPDTIPNGEQVKSEQLN